MQGGKEKVTKVVALGKNAEKKFSMHIPLHKSCFVYDETATSLKNWVQLFKEALV